MNYEDVQKVSNAAKNKIGLLNTNFLKYFLRAVMAGFFIDVAVIYSNVAGNVFSGSICIFGKDMAELTVEDKALIGVALSDSGFSECLTVKQIMHVLTDTYERFEREKFEQRCKAFSIPMNKKLTDFSTGMKAKLKVLVATSFQAKLLVLDEPTAGLDVIARDSILELLREYMETEGRSILISSHISSDLENLCDDIYMIDR